MLRAHRRRSRQHRAAAALAAAGGGDVGGGVGRREYIYRATVPALPGRCLAQAVLAGVGLAAETLYLLLSGSDGRGAAAAIYLLLQACVLVLALLTRRAVPASDWQMEKHGGLTTE